MNLITERLEDDSISDISFKDDNFIEDDNEGFLYFKGEIIEKVDILFYYEEENYIKKFIRRSSKGKIKNLTGRVYPEDNNIIEVITDLVINHIMYFIKDDIRFIQLFFKYIESLSNLFEMKEGTLQVKLKIGFWLKNLLDLNYKRKKFFWKKIYKNNI